MTKIILTLLMFSVLSIAQASEVPPSTAYAPALTSTQDTCMGSTSVGASGAVFSLSFGKTWTDANCIMLKNTMILWNMGFKGAAIARLCMDDLNREALEATGLHCPARRATKDDMKDVMKPDDPD